MVAAAALQMEEEEQRRTGFIFTKVLGKALSSIPMNDEMRAAAEPPGPRCKVSMRYRNMFYRNMCVCPWSSGGSAG